MILFYGPSLSPVTGQSYSFAKTFEFCNFDKVCVTFCPGLKSFLSLFKVLYFILKYKPKCIYFTSSRTTLGFIRDFIIVSISSLFSIKIVNHLHGNDFISFRSSNKYLLSIIDNTYNKISASIILSSDASKHYKFYKNMQLFVLKNFYSKQLVYDPSLKCKNTIVFMSNLMYSKGIFLFLDAVIKASNLGLKLDVHICGTARADKYMTEAQVRQKIKTYQNLEFINFHGFITDNEKNYILNKSSLFVLPTFYETEALPISMIEALFLGNNLLVSDKGYISQNIPCDVILLDEISVDKIVELILMHVASYNIDVSHNYNNFALKNFSEDKYTICINEILSKYAN